jgi:hypothetical protein
VKQGGSTVSDAVTSPGPGGGGDNRGQKKKACKSKSASQRETGLV